MESEPHKSRFYAQLKKAYYDGNTKVLFQLKKSLKEDMRLLKDIFETLIEDNKSPSFLQQILECIPKEDEFLKEAPLLAIRYNNLPILRFLMEVKNSSNKNALVSAFAQGNPLIIKYLLSFNKVWHEDDLEVYAKEIEYAHRENYRELALRLLQKGVDQDLGLISSIRKSGNFSILVGLWGAGFKQGDLDFLELLEKNGASINEILDGETKITPLEMAASFRNAQLIKYLILKGANLNYFNESPKLLCFSPLSAVTVSAFEEGCLHREFLYKSTKLMVRHGADPKLRRGDGKTAKTLMKEKIVNYYAGLESWWRPNENENDEFFKMNEEAEIMWAQAEKIFDGAVQQGRIEIKQNIGTPSHPLSTSFLPNRVELESKDVTNFLKKINLD